MRLSAPAMSVWFPAPVSPISGITSSCVDKDPGRNRRPAARRDPDFRAGPRRAGRRQCPPETTLLQRPTSPSAVQRRRGRVHRRRHAFAARRRTRRPLIYVYAAAREIAEALKGFTVVVTKSTVPVGAGDEVERIIRETRPDADFAVASNPEFLREGAAIDDFKRPDRIVVGTTDLRARAVMSEVYRPLNLNQPPLFFVDRRTAELIKYAANAFLATKITFINEIADLCEKVGANVQDVARGIGMDNRIGVEILARGSGLSAAHAFPRIRWRSSRRRRIPTRLCASSRRWSPSTTSASAAWPRRLSPPAAVRCAARPLRCSASLSNPIPTTCATRRRFPSSRRWKTPARRCAPMIPKAMDQARALMPHVDLLRRPL